MQNCRASFGHLWQQQDLSDVTLVLKTQDAVLQQFPAHVVLLSISPYFKSQVERWSTSSSTKKPTVALSLSDAEQLPAAMTVLAAMYGVDPDPNESLTDEQLLQILLVADMLQIEHITAMALQQFMQYAEKGFSSRCIDQLMGLPQLPAGLLQQFPTLTERVLLHNTLLLWMKSAAPSSPCSLETLLKAPHSGYMQHKLCMQMHILLSSLEAPNSEYMKRLLMSKVQREFGIKMSITHDSLEFLMAFCESRQNLLSLPLPVMQLLLSSDNLKVSSEDTVLLLAQSYVTVQPTEQQQQTAQQLLAPLVRCPYLSPFWLTASLVSTRADKLLLGPYIPQIRQLAPFLQAYPAESAASSIRLLIPNTPSSWAMQPRSSSSTAQQADTVLLGWDVPWLSVTEACSQAACKGRSVFIASKDMTQPLCGLMWRVELHAVREPRWKRGREEEDDKTGTLGLFAVPVNCPPGMFFRYQATIAAGNTSRSLSEPADAFGNKGAGWSDFFGLGPLPLHTLHGWARDDPRKLLSTLQEHGLPAESSHLQVSLKIKKAA